MSNKVKIVLNGEGVRSLLRSPEMEAICGGLAADAAARCGAGYTSDTYTGKNRVNAEVRAETYQAKRDNTKNNTILKSLRGG